MDIQDFWERALRHTEVVRPRVQPLSTAGTTRLPYIFLAESSLHAGDSVVRKGEIMVEKPAIILPSNLPFFEGFESAEPEAESILNEERMSHFFLVRGIQFPSLKYNNQTHALDVYEGGLQKAIRHYQDQLEKIENISTGLVIGPEDCWQFSVLIFIAGQMMRQSEGDFKKLWEEFRKRKEI